MDTQAREELDAISDRDTVRQFRRQVDAHNERVMSTIRTEVERIDRTERPQWRNVFVGVLVVFVIFAVVIGLYLAFPWLR